MAVDHLGVDALGRRRAGGPGLVPAAGGALEQCLAHLRAAGVVEADEEDPRHDSLDRSIDMYLFNRYT